MKRTDIRTFLIGVSVGTLTGLMFAPYAGRTMRSRITGAATDGGTQVKACGEMVRDAVLRVMEHSKDAISLHKEGVVEAIKRGTQAYKQAVS